MIRQQTRAALVFLKMTGKAKNTVEEEEESIKSMDICFRGLEDASSAGARQRIRRRRRSMAAVLYEQRRQREQEEPREYGSSSRLIANAYAQFTRNDMQDARKKALLDQLVAPFTGFPKEP